MFNNCERLCEARVVSETRNELCTAHVFNPFENPLKLIASENLATAEKDCIVNSKSDPNDNNLSQKIPDHLRALVEET